MKSALLSKWPHRMVLSHECAASPSGRPFVQTFQVRHFFRRQGEVEDAKVFADPGQSDTFGDNDEAQLDTKPD